MSRKQKKPKFNPKKNMYELLRMLSEDYGMYDDRVDEFHNPSLNELAREYGLNVIKVRKILITAGVYSTEVSRLIYELNSQGLSMSEIAEQTGLSKASINSYLPYQEYAYKLPVVSVDADRSKLYRTRKSCVNHLQTEMSERSLWNTILLINCSSLEVSINWIQGLCKDDRIPDAYRVIPIPCQKSTPRSRMMLPVIILPI